MSQFEDTQDTDYGDAAAKNKRRKMIYIALAVFCCVTIITGISIGIWIATRPGEEAKEFEGSAILTSSVNKTVSLNVTVAFNTTVRINASCVNETTVVDAEISETVTICTNETEMTIRNTEVIEMTRMIAVEVTEVVTGTFAWFDDYGDWDYALNGADVVAYFSIDSSANAVAGDDAYTTTVYGQAWRFSSQENKDLFDDDPARYVPDYGAHCAYAMGKGYIASGDPNAWTVHDGRLFINYSKGIRTQWLNDRDSLISKGDSNWAKEGYDNP